MNKVAQDEGQDAQRAKRKGPDRGNDTNRSIGINPPPQDPGPPRGGEDGPHKKPKG